MPQATTLLLIALGVVAVAFIVYWVWTIQTWRRAAQGRLAPTPYELVVGFVTDFLDTLGIGSFATTTAFYKARKTVPDDLIPGTLNIGHTIPTLLQAFLYTESVPVDPTTLISLIVAAVAGAWLGAGFVATWPKRKIQLGMGLALLGAAVVMTLRALNVVEPGTATGLEGGKLVVGLAGNFALGALMTIGIGLYGPCMILVSLLGMNPTTAFPIMMGSCAFLMPVADVQFLRHGRYSLPAALGLALAGTVGVWIAAKIVQSMNLKTVMWLVVVVVVYTGISMLLSAARERGNPSP